MFSKTKCKRWKHSRSDRSTLHWSRPGAGSAGSTELIHVSGLENSYCVWACHVIIPVRRLTEWVVTEGWRAKQMVLGKQRKKTAKTLSLFLKWVQLTHRSVPCGNKTLHTFHLWNSAKLWRITTQDGFRILKECDFHIHGYYTTLLNVHLCRKEE